MAFQLAVQLLCVYMFLTGTTIKVASAAIPDPAGPMKENGVVPDIIDEAPKDVLGVAYPSGAKVDLGNALTPSQVKDQPTITFNATDGTLYTLVMIDPDAPSRDNPKNGEWQHWMIVNIPGSRIDEGQVINKYNGASPPPKTGFHRYVLLVFQQPGELNKKSGLSDDVIERIRSRRNFKVKEFAANYNLGQPIAGNFFLSTSS